MGFVDLPRGRYLPSIYAFSGLDGDGDGDCPVGWLAGWPKMVRQHTSVSFMALADGMGAILILERAVRSKFSFQNAVGAELVLWAGGFAWWKFD